MSQLAEAFVSVLDSAFVTVATTVAYYFVSFLVSLVSVADHWRALATMAACQELALVSD